MEKQGRLKMTIRQSETNHTSIYFFFSFPIQLYWAYTRTLVNIDKRQSATKWKLQLEADKKETIIVIDFNDMFLLT